jgi:GT2 family glycosyltransferase
VRLITSASNLGFGGACNLAADSSQSDLLFFVNPDARLGPGTTGTLIDAIWTAPTVAAAGPRITDPTGRRGAASAGSEPTLRAVFGHFLLVARIPLLARWFAPLQLPFGSPAQTVDWVSGAAMMVRRDAFRRVGGFDASMFLYMEDVDLCRRLRAVGWTIRFEPAAVVAHDLGGSQGSEQAERWFRAFHRYVAGQRGVTYARVTSAVAAVGMALRSAVMSPRQPEQSRQLARAARTAAFLALRGTAPHHASLDP